jgi:hypothetical protein
MLEKLIKSENNTLVKIVLYLQYFRSFTSKFDYIIEKFYLIILSLGLKKT